MAFNKIELNDDSWTLIGDNVSLITFQNVSQWPIYINFNSSNTAPSESFGIIYKYMEKEVKKSTTDLTSKASPNYVFAKSVSRKSTIIVEQ